ncbi:MAG TPA: aspartyl/asparaginyl beta-hydroxylase domain-containing protein [Rhizomicrobium sp.]|nr:aspartyl/asparaginyl beta-hydroxylase domain-containing protein [Rhizomicrobium sp.]
MQSWYSLAGDGLRWLYDRRISAPPILNAAAKFPSSADFVDAWEDLRDEALAVARRLHEVPRFHEVMQQQREISANDGRDWRTFVTKAYGAPVSRNLKRCPVLARLLARYPEVVSATFSYLAPGKHIPLHRGPFRGVLRFHLGLSMPRDAQGNLGATLWIDGVPHLLADGECLLWDDTYPHEVLNATNDVRIALLLDVYRPDMPADMALLSSAVISAVGTIARFKPDVFTG